MSHSVNEHGRVELHGDLDEGDTAEFHPRGWDSVGVDCSNDRFDSEGKLIVDTDYDDEIPYDFDEDENAKFIHDNLAELTGWSMEDIEAPRTMDNAEHYEHVPEDGCPW